MKTIFIFLLVTISLGQIATGKNSFRLVSEKFKNHDQFFYSELSKQTINLYLKEKKVADELKNVLQNLNMLNVLSFEINNQETAAFFWKSIAEQYDLDAYVPFKISSSGFDQHKIFIKEKSSNISDLLVIKTSLSQASIVEIKGIIKLEEMAVLNKILSIKGLESLNTLKEEKQTNSQVSGITVHNNFGILPNSGFRVYNKVGTKIMEHQNTPFVLINGYQSKSDFQSSLAEIDPECIQSINVEKKSNDFYPHGLIDITLKGNVNDLYIVCDGTLFFGQDGYLQRIKIDDDCSPALLYNCKQKPLSEIIEMKPDEIKSIELTIDPRNCEGILEGEYVVIESK